MQKTKIEILEFSQIVLKQLVAISELSSQELRNTTRTTYQGNQTITETNEDTNISYIQLVENLAYLLKPHFDKKMKEVFKDNIKKINSYFYEGEEVFKEEFKKFKKSEKLDLKDEKLVSTLIISLKLKCAKQLFSELNMLLKRQGYLSKNIYGEENLDEVAKEQ